MKVTIDTERKVVEIDCATNIKDLIDGLKGLLGDEWKEYSVEQKFNSYSWPYWPIYPYYTYTTPDYTLKINNE